MMLKSSLLLSARRWPTASQSNLTKGSAEDFVDCSPRMKYESYNMYFLHLHVESRAVPRFGRAARLRLCTHTPAICAPTAGAAGLNTHRGRT